MAAPSALACAVCWSALLAAALADTTGGAQATTASAKAGSDDAETISAEYVVHPDIHPLERIEQWTQQIEKNNGSASATAVCADATATPPLERADPAKGFAGTRGYTRGRTVGCTCARSSGASVRAFSSSCTLIRGGRAV